MADDPRIQAALKAAVKQLETAVREQEGAVERILGLVELLMAKAPSGPIYLKLEAIMEACGFQDLTGQRIRKVARLIKLMADQGELAPVLLEPPAAAKKGLSQADVDRLLNGK